jgi:hypothetical protein
MDLVLVHPRYVFVLAFTCGTSPHNAQTKLSLVKEQSRKAWFSFPGSNWENRSSAMGEQAPAVDKAASGGWALNPRHECRGTSPVMIGTAFVVERWPRPAGARGDEIRGCLALMVRHCKRTQADIKWGNVLVPWRDADDGG